MKRLYILMAVLLACSFTGCNGVEVNRGPRKVYYNSVIRRNNDSTWIEVYEYSLDTMYIEVKTKK